MTTLELAIAALDRGDWNEVLALLSEPVDESDRSTVLELRAQAAYGAGEFEEAVAAWEELVTHERGRGDDVAAARAAAMVAMYLMMDTGLMAPVRGWLRTAEELLDGHERTAAHALVAMTRTYERFMCGDMESSRPRRSSSARRPAWYPRSSSVGSPPRASASSTGISSVAWPTSTAWGPS
jgi:hypothetical protein